MENWKQIKDYNYEVNKIGEVRNIKTKRVLSQRTSVYGYKLVDIQINKKNKTFLVHRLLGETFIPNIDNKPQIDHINRVRGDNRLENLRWVTSAENNRNRGEYKRKVKKDLIKNIIKLYKNGKSIDEIHKLVN